MSSAGIFSEAERQFLYQFFRIFPFDEPFITVVVKPDSLSKSSSFILDVCVREYATDARQITNEYCALVSPAGLLAEEQERIAANIIEQEVRLADTPHPWPYSWDTCVTQGKPPQEVLGEVTKMLNHGTANNRLLVSHSFLSYAFPILQRHVGTYVPDQSLTLRESDVFDFGLFEKALQLGAIPDANQSLVEWFAAVNRMRASGVKWSLQGHIKERYALKGAADVSPHSAAYSADLLADLWRVFREISWVMRGEDVKAY